MLDELGKERIKLIKWNYFLKKMNFFYKANVEETE